MDEGIQSKKDMDIERAMAENDFYEFLKGSFNRKNMYVEIKDVNREGAAKTNISRNVSQ